MQHLLIGGLAHRAQPWSSVPVNRLTLPSGIVAFFFSDIEGSTQLLHALGDAYAQVLEEHRVVVRKAFADHNGIELSTEGDSFFAVFAQASDAVLAAFAAQLGLVGYPWTQEHRVRVRIGVHVGEARIHDAGYTGMAVHLAARVMNAAHGGQVLMSKTCVDLAASVLSGDLGARDLGLHRLKDMPEPERLYQLTHPDLNATFPSLRTLSARPNNLPVQLTSFVGRDRELEELVEVVAGARLVTITGSGGAGKTRLALRVVAEAMDGFPDGVWLVDLASVTDPQSTTQSVASALGVRDQQGRSVEECLLDHVRDRRQLIVLDNCEHLIESCAVLVERLLTQCEDLHIVATSREPLGVAGERSWRIPSLASPEPGSVTAADAMKHDAVHLFVDRAVLADPSFALDDANAPTVAEICRRLDGIPLAIELAAARVVVLPVDQLAARMHDRLRLLTGGSRTALSRQQTLRATVEWSYGLLSTEERALLRTLSVFLGGFTLEAASGVFGVDVLEGVTSLIAKSLVVPEAGSRARFRLLETIRLHAREKLLDEGESEAVHARHADYFAEHAINAEPHAEGPDQRIWIGLLDDDYENLVAALAWHCETHPDRAVAMAASMWRLWWVRGRWGDGHRQLLASLDAANWPRTLAAARARWAAAFMVWSRDAAVWERPLHEAAAIQREGGDSRGLAYTLFTLGWAMADEPKVQDALALARECGDGQITAWCLLVVGSRGDVLESKALHEEAIQIARAGGDRWSMAMGLNNVGEIDYLYGDFEGGVARIEEALAIFDELRDTFGLQESLRNLAKAAFLRRRSDEVAAWVDRARQALRGSDGESYLPTILVWLAMDAAVRCDAKAARRIVDECAGALSSFLGRRNALSLVAYVLLGIGEAAGASALLEDVSNSPNTDVGEDASSIVAAIAQGASGRREPFSKALPGALSQAESTDPWWIAPLIEQLAGFVVADAPCDAARLLGAADAVRARHGGAILPAFTASLANVFALGRARIDREMFDAAVAQGAECSTAEAVELATSLV